VGESALSRSDPLLRRT